MRRVFIIRKDLNLTHGKLAAMVGHCAEAYWTNLLKRAEQNYAVKSKAVHEDINKVWFDVEIPREIWTDYVNGIFTKTICEAKNLTQLKKVDVLASELGLVAGVDWGYINDCCLTELTPENSDGTTTVGAWFKPLADDIAHKISKKFKLYGAFDKR